MIVTQCSLALAYIWQALQQDATCDPMMSTITSCRHIHDICLSICLQPLPDVQLRMALACLVVLLCSLMLDKMQCMV